MNIEFKESYLQELAKDKVLTGKQLYSIEVIQSYKKRIFQIKNAKTTQDLRMIKNLHFEKLKEKRYQGKYSIRLHGKYRLIFGTNKHGGIEVILIEVILIEVILIEEISDHYA